MIVVDSGYVLKKLNDDDYIILDVRTKMEFEEGRIKNSVNIDFYDLISPKGGLKDKKFLQQKFSDISKDKQVIIYCMTGVRAHYVEQIMAKILNYVDLKVYEKSFTDWVANNLSIER